MITFGDKKAAQSVQFNCRLQRDILRLIEDGCRQTGLSQSKFLSLCVLKQSNEIPGLVRDLQRAVWKVLSKDAVNGTLK